MSGWGCPHEADKRCQRVNNKLCDPGMKGCVLFGRFKWADESKNRPHRKKHDHKTESEPEENGEPHNTRVTDE